MRISKTRLPFDDRNSVAFVKILAITHLVINHTLHCSQQIITGHATGVATAIEKTVLLFIGVFPHHMNKTLTRDGPQVRATATDQQMILDNSNSLARLGQFDRRPLTTGATTDHDRIEMIFLCFHSHF